MPRELRSVILFLFLKLNTGVGWWVLRKKGMYVWEGNNKGSGGENGFGASHNPLPHNFLMCWCSLEQSVSGSAGGGVGGSVYIYTFSQKTVNDFFLIPLMKINTHTPKAFQFVMYVRSAMQTEKRLHVGHPSSHVHPSYISWTLSFKLPCMLSSSSFQLSLSLPHSFCPSSFADLHALLRDFFLPSCFHHLPTPFVLVSSRPPF